MSIFSIDVYAKEKNSQDVVRVGIYEYEPYIMVDSDGNISGYYSDLFDLLEKNFDFQYEYVVCDIAEGLKRLEAGSIDIMLGLPIDINLENMIFNKYYIEREKFAIFSDMDIDLNSLEKFNVVRLGIVEGDYNADWILDFFEANNINVKTIYAANYEVLETLLEDDKIDLMVDSAYKECEYKKVYEFVGHQVYIAGNKNSEAILTNIDKSIEKFGRGENNQIEKLHNKYFDNQINVMLLQRIILIIIGIILSLLAIIFLVIPQIKKNHIKNKIRIRINKDKYLLQYQPIYNPTNKTIVGFEGLLRLSDENNKIIPPYKFIPEIEKNDMLFDISLWILEKAIIDYNKIKSYECMRDKDFYISINVSLNEIENDYFVEQAIGILYRSQLGRRKICLEIIERVRSNNLDKIIKNINILKSAGFKIAIDDFGVEYSNLDILHKLDTDIIKIDKHFVDGIGKDLIRNEIVLFIARIAQAENKAVVLEGVEEEYQHDNIRKIENDSLYVQGYFYNKPMYIDDIKSL